MPVRTDFKAALEQFTGKVRSAITPEQIKLLGEEAIRQIQVRTRLGYGVDGPGEPRKKLKPLSDGYIEKRAKERSKLSEFTAPGRSNATFSGQLLESLGVKSTKIGAITIEPTGTRSDGQTNMEVAESLTRSGRAFLSLSDLELKKFARFYEKEILARALRRIGLTK